ncbi:LOW QUALITY PROTEIN: protein lifeguard 1 [Drosophila eugracilis]|uniref:LOW QUALITY PROTEIN: protein lifeguard 1 n=1 Tax=Drosophila eugracilis TaxID=29029 RepID=UPI001BDB67FF|nr:LOW QUALITY PROTEIN: protein lifeguard 1 [Drosophila eugracilis]
MQAVCEPVQQYGNRSHQAECIPLGRYPAYGSDIDPEHNDKGLEFSNASIRRGFIRKVYLILLAQLITSLVVIVSLNFNKNVRLTVAENSWIFLLAMLIVFVLLVSLACNEDLRRKTPGNFIILGLLTLGESILLGVAACRYAPSEIFMAVSITTAVCVGLTLFAMQTRYDFTMMGGMLVSFLIILLLFGIITVFVGQGVMTTIYCALSAMLFSAYLVYDTQLMMGGKHRFSISPEEYIFAALNIYLDVVNIFLDVLQILGGSDA